MNKLYSTIAAVALGVASAFAAAPVDYAVSNDGPKGEAYESTATEMQFPIVGATLPDGTQLIAPASVNSAAVASHRQRWNLDNRLTAAARQQAPRRVASIDELYGTYIIFCANTDSLDLPATYAVVLEAAEEAGKVKLTFPANSSYVTDCVGTVDLTAGTITVANADTIGYYKNSSGAEYDVCLRCTSTGKKYFSEGNVVLKINADGTLGYDGEAGTGFGIYGINRSTQGVTRFDTYPQFSVARKANAHLAFTWTTTTDYTAVDIPVYAEYTGNRTEGGQLLISCVSRYGYGQPITATLDTEGNISIVDQVASVSYNSSKAANSVLKVCDYSASGRPTLVKGTYSEDLKTVKWNGTGATPLWAIRDAALGLYQGKNTEATLTIDNVIDNRTDGPEPEIVKTENLVCFYTPYFTNYIDTIDMTHPVVIDFYDNNTVEVHGLCGISKYMINPNFTQIAPVKGTYDPVTETITIPSNQQVSVVGTNNIVICWADLENGKFNRAENIILTKDESGAWVPNCGFYACTDAAASAYAAEIDPIFLPANGELALTSNLDGAYKAPFFYTFQRNEQGQEIMYTSGLMIRAASGYAMEWVVDGDTATATDQIGMTALSNNVMSYYYVCSTPETTSQRVAKIVADVSDPCNVKFPMNIGDTEIVAWAIIQKPADGNSYYGWCTKSSITGTAERAPEPMDVSPICGTYTATTFTGSEYYWFTENEKWTAFDYSNEVEVTIVPDPAVDGGVIVNNLTYLEEDLKGVVDFEKKTITFPVQDLEFWYVEENGDTVSIAYTFTSTANIAKGETAPVVATFDENNVITLSDWTFAYYDDEDSTYYYYLANVKEVLTPKAPEFKELFVRGELPGTTGWSAEEAYKMTTEDGLVYTITLPANTLSNDGSPIAWKIATADWADSFGCGGAVAPGTVTTYWNGDNNISNIPTEVTITLTTTAESWAKDGTAQLTVTGEEYKYIPETLCVIGELVEGNWSPAKVVALTKQGNVFSGTVALAGPFFSFCEQASESGSWDGIGKRWGAEKNDFEIAVNTPATIVLGNNDNAFKLSTTEAYPVVATFEVNFDDMTVTVKAAESGIGVIAADNAEGVFYNLQGVRVANPANGVFIMRQGDKAVKVYVK